MGITHLVTGPEGHGVTEYALSLAKATGGTIIRDDSPLPPGPVHVTFTDHLFGPTPEKAVDRVLSRCAGHRLSLSLHDIPQPQEGASRFERRARAYRRLAEAADLVVTNSHHEASFFALGTVEVIHLPVPMIESHYDPEPHTVGLLGFIYPGKGHDDILRALTGSGLRVRALGGVSQGHESWATELTNLATASGLDFSVTGYLPAKDLATEMGRIAVPVCAHRHYSASGSLMSWLGAGRRVLVSDSPYTREIAELWPEHITLVADGAWHSTILTAAHSPATAPRPSRDWDWPEVAARWQELWSDLWPSISVVIPYYNNPAGLSEVVRAVQAQDYPGSVEIIVADDGSTIPVPELGVTVVSQADLGFRAAAARNLGASVATGEILSFFDGDTVPEPGYLRAAVAHACSDPRAIIVGTRLTGADRTEPTWLTRAWEETNHLADSDETSWRFIISAALTCSRAFFQQVGGFDANLVGYGGEDWEFGFRSWQHGATFIHEPAAVAIHAEEDWGGRNPDVVVKNAETISLARRITHPIARPAGVIFDRADIAVQVPLFDAPGITDTVIAGFLAAGDVAVITPEPSALFDADPRVRPAEPHARITISLHSPAFPDDSLSELVEEVCHQGGYAVLTANGAKVATVRSRRSQALGLPSTPITMPVDWEIVAGPQRLERRFAGW